jgi:hypothetical protein
MPELRWGCLVDELVMRGIGDAAVQSIQESNIMRVIPIGSVVCLLAACSGNSSDKSANDIASLQAQISSLTERISGLENDVHHLKTQADTANVIPPAKTAVITLLGSTAKGQPIQIEFGTRDACEKARKSIMDEGLRACAGHDDQDSTSTLTDGQCPKPQVSCLEQ